MKCKLNTKACVAFAILFIIGLVGVGSTDLEHSDMIASIAFFGCLVLLGFLIEKAGLGKYFGGKT